MYLLHFHLAIQNYNISVQELSDNILLPSSWEHKHFKGNLWLYIYLELVQFTVKTLIWQYVKFIGTYTMISVCRQVFGSAARGRSAD